MAVATQVSPVRALSLIAKSVFIQLVRRQEFYVLFILMGIFLMGALAVSMAGIESAATATFLVNLGMTLSYYAAHVLTLILAGRQIPDEIERRTLYPLLAKPVDRSTVLLGKWAASTLSGIAVFLVLLLIGWLPVPKMESYAFGLLLQTIVLQCVSLAMIAAMAILFSLVLPRAVTLILLVLLFVFGDNAIGFLRARFIGSSLDGAARWVSAYIPDFSRLNSITRYTDGIAPLTIPELLGLILYGAIITALCILLAMWLFRRREL